MIDFEKIVYDELKATLDEIREGCEGNSFYNSDEQGLADDILYYAIDNIHDCIHYYIERQALEIAAAALDRSIEE